MWEQVRPPGHSQPWNVFIENNRLYHQTIVTIGANRQLMDLIDTLQLPVMMIQVGRAMQPEHAERSHKDHVRIAEAILAANPDAAESAMRQHLRGSADWVLKLPDVAFKPE